MAGRPKTREKRRLMEEAKKNAGIASMAEESLNEAVKAAAPGDTTASSCEDPFVVDAERLKDMISSVCSPNDVKLATTPPDTTDKATPSSLVEHILACQRVIALLLEDTKAKVSSVETLDAAQMALRVTSYFEECDRRKRSYTVPGLAYAIGFINRKQLISFVTDFYETLPGYIVARALMRIEEQRNVEILSSNGMMTGHKLDLATNFDWMDTKNRSSKDDEKPTQHITQNVINYNSLPPQSMTVEEWQQRFLAEQKERQGQPPTPAIDVGQKD